MKTKSILSLFIIYFSFSALNAQSDKYRQHSFGLATNVEWLFHNEKENFDNFEWGNGGYYRFSFHERWSLNFMANLFQFEIRHWEMGDSFGTAPTDGPIPRGFVSNGHDFKLPLLDISSQIQYIVVQNKLNPYFGIGISLLGSADVFRSSLVKHYGIDIDGNKKDIWSQKGWGFINPKYAALGSFGFNYKIISKLSLNFESALKYTFNPQENNTFLKTWFPEKYPEHVNNSFNDYLSFYFRLGIEYAFISKKSK